LTARVCLYLHFSQQNLSPRHIRNGGESPGQTRAFPRVISGATVTIAAPESSIKKPCVQFPCGFGLVCGENFKRIYFGKPAFSIARLKSPMPGRGMPAFPHSRFSRCPRRADGPNHTGFCRVKIAACQKTKGVYRQRSGHGILRK